MILTYCPALALLVIESASAVYQQEFNTTAPALFTKRQTLAPNNVTIIFVQWEEVLTCCPSYLLSVLQVQQF